MTLYRRLTLLASCLALTALFVSGQSLYDPGHSPICTWTCGNGASGGSSTANSDLKCKQACQQACGGICFAL